MTNKTQVAVIFGGKSAEFEISLISCSNIINAIDRSKYDVYLIGIDKKGNWFYNPSYPNTNVDLSKNDYFGQAYPIEFRKNTRNTSVIDITNNRELITFDVGYGYIHGTYGEDGTLQGYFKALDIPFIGPDVLGSAVCMDKELTKRILRDSNIPIAAFITLYKYEDNSSYSFEYVTKQLGTPIFVKPCNAGSSVGVSKVTNEEEYKIALEEAFKYDKKILIEEAIIGKEVECAILGNEQPKASVLGEIIATKDFYSYDAKYNDDEGYKMQIPADIPNELSDIIREKAILAFKAVGCEGLSRVDFFVTQDGKYVLNEINTLPGFTSISMYPKLWEKTGIEYSDLITQLIELSLDRYRKNKALMF